MTDDELEDLSYHALEELLGCGVERRTLLRYFKTIRNRATPAPAQPDPLHVANERGEEAKDAARYRRFFDAGLPITFMGVEYDDKASLDAAIDADLAQEEKT